MKPLFVAEVKTESPFGFKSKKRWWELFEIANKHGDMLSIHTHSQWGGRYNDILEARSETDKKILAKGIHGDDADIKRALDCGADYVLVVGRIPPKGLIEHCWVEPTESYQFTHFPKNVKAVWNQRDLFNGHSKAMTFEDIVSCYKTPWLCQASGIKEPKDVHPKANAFIVGEHLPEFVKKWRPK